MKFDLPPSKEFKEKAKGRFLAAFDAHYPVPARPRPSEFILAMRALAIVLGCVAVIFGGASVYADTTNVPADNILYPLKRLTESVQLVLTVPSARPQLEATFAAQRAVEISDLAERHPSSTLIPHLENDLNVAVNASIKGAENGVAPVHVPSANTMIAPHMPSVANPPSAANTSTGPDAVPSIHANNDKDHEGNGNNGNDLQRVCGTLRSFLNPSSSVVAGGFLDDSGAFQQFQDHCGGSSRAPRSTSSTVPLPVPGEVHFPNATTTTFSTTTATTTTTTSTFRGFLSGDQHGFESEDGDASTTPPVLPTSTLRRGGDDDGTNSRELDGNGDL